MKYALQVEMHLFKEQILERYLNVASFGWLLVPAR
jgi:membrane peptidoglycan carboxypeptidase